jgi:hypothetical protein
MPAPSRPGAHPPHLPPRRCPCKAFPTPSRYHSPSSFEIRYQAHYGVDLGKQVAKKDGVAAAAPADVKKSKSVLKKATAVKARGDTRVIDKVIFATHLVAHVYIMLCCNPAHLGFRSCHSLLLLSPCAANEDHPPHAFDNILFFEVSNLTPFPPISVR